MVTVRKERPAEAAARDALLDLAYGPARFTKASERSSEGRRAELALVAAEGRRICVDYIEEIAEYELEAVGEAGFEIRESRREKDAFALVSADVEQMAELLHACLIT